MRHLAIPTLLASVFLIGSSLLGAQNTCAPADDNSAHIIGVFKRMMQSDQADVRDSVGLPLVDPTQITLVSDALICAQAGAAGDSIVKVWVPGATHAPTTAPLYVIRIGTFYAVADLSSPPDPQDEFDSILIFGPAWDYRSIVAM